MLIEKFEWFCHRTYRLVGLNSVFWGKTCIFYYAAAVMSQYLLDWTWWFLLILPFNFLVFNAVYRPLNEKRPKIGDTITANVYRYYYRFWRFFALGCLFADILYSIDIRRPSGGIGLTLALYFLAVDDLPSQPSKLRVWLESLFTPDPLPSAGSARNQNG